MALYEYDIAAIRESGGCLLCGIDEAGRGPLAGPVYAAAVILPKDCNIAGLDDSKKLTEKKREALYAEITEKAVAYGIASVTAKEIDEINILRAAMLAMRKAFDALIAQLPPQDIKPPESRILALVDGNANPELSAETRLIVKGDATSACIAAASILAKVSRDRHMLELCKKYPGYAFDKHKGYGTKAHYDALGELGACAEHRESFLKKWRAKSI